MKKIIYSLLALSFSYAVSAQDSTQNNYLEQVVVTATKYPVKLRQTARLVTIITQEQIEKSGGKDLAQLLNEQAGIVVSGANSNPGKDKAVYIRGAKNDYTLILIDGVPVADPSGVGGAFDIRLLPLEGIERIEILKGSQSTLYGADAVAGVINIITKTSGNKKIALAGGASYGSYNSFNGNAGVNGHTSLVDYNFNYNYSATDGISEATDTTGKANFDKDGFIKQSFNGSLSFKAGEKLKISPYYRYSYYKGDFDADAFTDGNNKFDYLLNNTGAIATYQLPKGSITANYGYSFAKRNYTNDYGGYGFRGRFQTGDLYMNQKLNDQVQLLAGVNLQSYRLLDTTLEKKNPETSIVSPYVSFLINSGNGVMMEIGSRYNHHSRFGSYFTYDANSAYQLNEKIRFFAHVSTGFKAPSVSQLFGAYGANPDLKPEKSTSLEGGIQTNFLENKLTLTATAFNREIKDLIAYIGNYLVNVDFQHDKGIELEAIFKPNSKWNFNGSYTYLTGVIQQTRNGKDTSFFNLIRRPKNAITAMVGYHVTKQFYISATFQSFGNRTDLFFAPTPPYKTSEVDLKAYALLNVYAEYQLAQNKIRLFADVKNLTNSSYTEVYGFNTLGTNINAGIRFKL